MSRFPRWLLPLGLVFVLMAMFGMGRMSPGRAGGPLPMTALIVVVGLLILTLVAWQRREEKQSDKNRIEETRTLIGGQLDAIASDILKLEDEVRAAGNDEALSRYREATATYTGAFQELETAETATDLTNLAGRLDTAIWQLDTTEALLDSRPLPPKPQSRLAAVSGTDRPQYRRRAGRSSCMGVSDMVVALLEGRALPSTTRSSSRMHGMRMGPIGMMGSSRRQPRQRVDSALEVLRRRYAAGELTAEEFDTMRRTLDGEQT